MLQDKPWPRDGKSHKQCPHGRCLNHSPEWVKHSDEFDEPAPVQCGWFHFFKYPGLFIDSIFACIRFGSGIFHQDNFGLKKCCDVHPDYYVSAYWQNCQECNRFELKILNKFGKCYCCGRKQYYKY